MKHGAFGWFELMTTDVAAAKEYYGKLFGWEYEEVPMDGGDPYTLVKVDGKPVAGMMGQPDECRGMPPCWDIYISVDNADDTVKMVTENGGKVLRPVCEIPDMGRFAVVQDPQGAVLMVMDYVKK